MCWSRGGRGYICYSHHALFLLCLLPLHYLTLKQLHKIPKLIETLEWLWWGTVTGFPCQRFGWSLFFINRETKSEMEIVDFDLPPWIICNLYKALLQSSWPDPPGAPTSHLTALVFLVCIYLLLKIKKTPEDATCRLQLDIWEKGEPKEHAEVGSFSRPRPLTSHQHLNYRAAFMDACSA